MVQLLPLLKGSKETRQNLLCLKNYDAVTRGLATLVCCLNYYKQNLPQITFCHLYISLHLTFVAHEAQACVKLNVNMFYFNLCLKTSRKKGHCKIKPLNENQVHPHRLSVWPKNALKVQLAKIIAVLKFCYFGNCVFYEYFNFAILKRFG